MLGCTALASEYARALGCPASWALPTKSSLGEPDVIKVGAKGCVVVEDKLLSSTDLEALLAATDPKQRAGNEGQEEPVQLQIGLDVGSSASGTIRKSKATGDRPKKTGKEEPVEKKSGTRGKGDKPKEMSGKDEREKSRTEGEKPHLDGKKLTASYVAASASTYPANLPRVLIEVLGQVSLIDKLCFSG